MPSILAIDTSATVCAAAIAVDDRVSTLESGGDRRAAQDILPLVQRLLDEQGIALGDLQGIAVVNGPGSFTGMRIGVGVAQALGMTSGKPVLAISSLAAMAMAASIEYSAPRLWLTALPARNKEVYLAGYRSDEEAGVVVEIPEQVGLLKQVLARNDSRLEAASTGVVAADAESLEDIVAYLGDGLQETLCLQRLPMTAVCRLAALLLAGQAFDGSRMALPNYVKEQMEYS